MNKRLLQLVAKAGTDTSGKWLSLYNAEELVRLTIQECIQAIHDEGKEYEIESAGSWQADNFSQAVRKHFGVE